MARITFQTDKARLTKKPDVRESDNGPYALFSLAVNHPYYDKKADKWKEKEPTFLNCIAFGKAAEFIQAADMSKGDMVYAQGRIETRTYEDDDEEEQKVHSFIVENMLAYPELDEDDEEFPPKSKKRSKSSSKKSGKKSKPKTKKSKKVQFI